MTLALVRPSVGDVAALLRRLRLHPGTPEQEIHERISAALREAGIPFRHEAPIAPRCRIDFLVRGGIGIEVKAGTLRGAPRSSAVAAQLARYASTPAVQCLVLVVEGRVPTRPAEIAGKRVEYVSLSKNWGVSL